MLDRKKHRQEVEALKADNRQKDMNRRTSERRGQAGLDYPEREGRKAKRNLSKDYVTEWRTYIAEPLQRDTLREVLGRAKRQSRATTITIDRNDKGDTLRIATVTDRYRGHDALKLRDKSEKIKVVRDTVYIEKRDSVMVQNTGLTNPTNTTKGSGFWATLKWIFWILIGLIGLIVTAKVCLLRR